MTKVKSGKISLAQAQWIAQEGLPAMLEGDIIISSSKDTFISQRKNETEKLEDLIDEK